MEKSIECEASCTKNNVISIMSKDAPAPFRFTISKFNSDSIFNMDGALAMAGFKRTSAVIEGEDGRRSFKVSRFDDGDDLFVHMLGISEAQQEAENIPTYSTLPDCIQHEIIEPIEAGGAAKASEYDIDAIADLIVRCDYSTPTPKYGIDRDVDFWGIVKAHVLTYYVVRYGDNAYEDIPIFEEEYSTESEAREEYDSIDPDARLDNKGLMVTLTKFGPDDFCEVMDAKYSSR